MYSYSDTLWSSFKIFEKLPTHDSKASNEFYLNINVFYSWFPSDISFQKDARQSSLLECLLNTVSFTHLNGSHCSPEKYLISLECSQPRNCDLGNRQILQIQPLCAVLPFMGHREPISSTWYITTLCSVYGTHVTETYSISVVKLLFLLHFAHGRTKTVFIYLISRWIM